MKTILSIICFLPGYLFAQEISNQQYKQDFGYFWTTINDYYCYWDKKQTDWNKVRNIYEPMVDTITSRKSFVGVLEKVFYEIYDHHASLNTNTPESERLVPSGADIWAEYVNGTPTVIEVKGGSGAALVGIKPGMEILSVNDVPVEPAIQTFLAKGLKHADEEARNFALRELLAGNHTDNRKITMKWGGKEIAFNPDLPVNLLETHPDKPAIESQRLKNNIGYILINNELGNEGLIAEFDSCLQSLADTKAMIIDLRNTPSGGVTTVARGILSRFISKEGFYQKHEYPAEEKQSGIKRSWVEIVSPRKPVYKNPLVILVDHWTGSVSEGIAIGFDGLKRATIMGTKMAALNGAISSFSMPNTGIGFSFPTEKLFHVNGKPRESFVPSVLVDVSRTVNNEDYILQQALKFLISKGK